MRTAKAHILRARMHRGQRVEAIVFIVLAILALFYGMYVGFYLSDSDDDLGAGNPVVQPR